MAEYIEREALLGDIEAAMENQGMGFVVGQTLKRYIKRQPAADVEPVRRGRWIPVNDGDVYFTCSYCGCEISTSWDYDELEWNFCPECGRAMDGGADND